MDQSEVSSAVQVINDSSLGPNIFCMCCGRFTPEQRQIVKRRCEIDTRLYIALYKWFVEESGHPAFKNLPLPKDIPAPVIIKDSEFDNNNDTPGNVNIENTFEGAKYYFSSGQDPSEQHSVYGSSQKFSVAMMKCSDPTLLTYGGNYANTREINIEDILLILFPYGIGGPKMKRRTRVSMEACFYKYNRVALEAFLRGDAVLVDDPVTNLACKSRLVSSVSSHVRVAGRTRATHVAPISVCQAQQPSIDVSGPMAALSSQLIMLPPDHCSSS